MDLELIEVVPLEGDGIQLEMVEGEQRSELDIRYALGRAS